MAANSKDDMTFRPLTAAETVSWYADELSVTFGPQERKPLADIQRMTDEGCYELWGLFDGDTLAGYATLWKAVGLPLVLLDYLGVNAARRGGGLGAEMLHRLKARGLSLVLESELPEEAEDEAQRDICVRRMAFYRRCGFEPVYRMATCGMAYQAMLNDPAGLPIEDVMRMHREIYGQLRLDVKVPLMEGEKTEMPYWMKGS